MAIGNWSSRADVLENGVKPIIRKVQDPLGYTAYSQYESDMRRVISRVQKAVSFEVQKGRHGKPEKLIMVACDLSHLLDHTEICKSARKSGTSWNAQRSFILSQNKWSAGSADVSAEDFAMQAKKLNVFYKLYGSETSDFGEASDDFSAFGSRKREPRTDTRVCHFCGLRGHVARNCPNRTRRDTKEIVCFRCGEPGHRAAECTGELKKKGK